MKQGRAAVILALAWSAGWRPAVLAGQEKPRERQIAEAVMPLPEAQRVAATVYGYRHGGTLAEVLREGSNNFVCLADTPGDRVFQVSCYHRSLEPFMALGRELRAQGLNRAQVQERRAEAVRAGTLIMPEMASMTSLRASLESPTEIPDSVNVLTVVYTPYATAESTGLSIRPAGMGMPWLMDPGRHRAHIMIAGPRIPFELAAGATR
jgi:hypothetical protein